MNSVLSLHLTPLKRETTYLESSEPVIIGKMFGKELLFLSFSGNLDYGFALEMRQAKPSTLHVSVTALHTHATSIGAMGQLLAT